MKRSRAGRFALSFVLATIALALTTAGCSKNTLIAVAMNGAPHATSHRELRVANRMVLAGDMHCHVLPPDAPSHVTRQLRETLDLAARESLDFVVLTPHIRARFFVDDAMRDRVLETQRQLRARIAELAPNLIVIPGFEYTDHRFGHVGASFADPAEVLGELTSESARQHPELFFERWVAHGGLLTINHPVNRGLREPPFRELAFDVSWRGFSERAVTPEVAWITTHAQAIETFNASLTHLRDQFLVGEEDRSLREASHLVDRTIRAQRRRIAAVGGSDSHGSWLRATTFVVAKERSRLAIRDAIASARTCVRGPEACTLEVRSSDGEPTWVGVGDALTTKVLTVEARASGGDVTFFVNGSIAARSRSGEIVSLVVPAGRCAIVRAIVGRSWSSAVHVNCQLEP